MTILALRSNMKTSKICLVILCLLSFRTIGTPQSHGATFFMIPELNLEIDKSTGKIIPEIWRPIPGFSNVYQASNYGRIKALKRKSPGRFGSTRMLKEKILSQTKNKYGYLRVTIGNTPGSFAVHRLICAAFLGESELMVDHINNNKSDNRIWNLQYLSNRENVHKYWMGRKKSSKHIGVCYHRASQKWIASIQVNGVSKYLGLFNSELDAAEAHKIEMKKIYA